MRIYRIGQERGFEQVVLSVIEHYETSPGLSTLSKSPISGMPVDSDFYKFELAYFGSENFHTPSIGIFC